MVVKEITSVDKNLIKNILISELLHYIIRNLPNDFKEIIIQLDNAYPHINDYDVDWREIGLKLRFAEFR